MWMALLLSFATGCASSVTPSRVDVAEREVAAEDAQAFSDQVSDAVLETGRDAVGDAPDAALPTLRITVPTPTWNSTHSGTLVADPMLWHSIGQYAMELDPPGRSGVTVDRLRLQLFGDSASYAEVAIYLNENKIGSNIPRAGVDVEMDIQFTDPIRFPLTGSTGFEIRVRLNPVVSCSTAACSSSGAAHSGNPIGAWLAGRSTPDSWGNAYAESFHVQTRTAEGDRLFARWFPLASTVYVAHKTRPFIQVTNLAETLTPGIEQRVFHFQIRAEPFGDLTWRQIAFCGDFGRVAVNSRFFTRYRLYRAEVEVPRDMYRFVDWQGRDLTEDLSVPFPATWRGTLTLAHEERISGAGPYYSLRATVGADVQLGDDFTIGLWNDATPYGNYYLTDRAFTGDPFIPSLLNADWGVVDMVSPTGLAPGGRVNRLGFAWSDLSEGLRHSDALGVDGGSRDWINGGEVPHNGVVQHWRR